MTESRPYLKTTERKTHSHTPIIECPEKVEAGKIFQIKISLGNGTGHPDTNEHHVRRISLYYSDSEGKTVRQIAGVEFQSHHPGKEALSRYETMVDAKFDESGMLHAMAYCNVHGLAEAIKQITVIQNQ
jgi:superoxide reductase